MNITRAFLVVGTIYLVLGIGLGMRMGASGDHSMMPVHAHINLLGFVLMAVFGLIYKTFPAMTNGRLATVHFWLHLTGSALLIVMLFLMFSGRIPEAAMVPAAPLAEGLVMLGVLTFAYNLWMNAR
ncbi:MAG: hypothetical protein ABI832_18910 [bacterium]